MKNQIEYYDFIISQHFLSALINGDFSGLSDSDNKDLLKFESKKQEFLPENFSHGHWSYDSEEEPSFRRCQITGLLSDCIEIEYIAFCNN